MFANWLFNLKNTFHLHT